MALSTLQVYHVANHTWETIATDPVPVAASGMGCAVMDDKLYAYGGVTASSTYIKDTYVYDPTAPAGSRWTALPDMTYARAWPDRVAVNGLVYAIGGLGSGVIDFSYVEAFDPGGGLWHTVTNMNTARGGPGAMFWGDTLFVCGGGWNTHLDTCESYDTTQGYAGTWVTMSQRMITGRRTYAYASLPEALYAVAGYSTRLPHIGRAVGAAAVSPRILLPVVLRATVP